MGSVVEKWTGLEARALREASRMSLRDFAAHLGVSEASVSHWEKRGAEARLRFETQQMLDTGLERAVPEVAARFERLLQAQSSIYGPGTAAPTDAQRLGQRSRQRTQTLFGPGASDTDEVLRPDPLANELFERFLDSPARVFVVAGGLGLGKTTLAQRFTVDWGEQADFQFHTSSAWSLSSTDLAAEILRYASIPCVGDTVLSLEAAAEALQHPCVVILDGIASIDQITFVGQQVDRILRLATSTHLRFVLVARTPPELDLSAFPVLSAATFKAADRSRAQSYTMAPWPTAQAQDWWDNTRGAKDMTFAQLPPPLRSLTGVPLYLRMLRDSSAALRTGNGHVPTNGFHLAAQCVQTVLEHAPQSAEATRRVLGHLACALDPDAIPSPLRQADPPALEFPELAGVPLVARTPDGKVRFLHDVFRTYFLAVQIAERIVELGRTSATVTAINSLARTADSSAQAHALFEFVVSDLVERAPHLVEAIALAPAITVDLALPMLLETTATAGPLNEAIVRACANRGEQAAPVRLSRALLATPNLTTALRDQHAPWIVEQLRAHGPQLWGALAQHIESLLDIRVSARIVDCINLDSVAEATFFARHLDLFIPPGSSGDSLLQLVKHIDWRVRAASAESLQRHGALDQAHRGLIVDHLLHDHDYKVRAALARCLGVLHADDVAKTVHKLLTDSNWHVRESALHGILIRPQTPLPDQALAATALRSIGEEPTWETPPDHVAKLLARLQLLSGLIDGNRQLAAESAALLGLMKEVRSGWIRLPPEHQQILIGRARQSDRWLLRREAEALKCTGVRDVSTVHERFRRRRGRRALQVALDVHSLGHALDITAVAVEAGADFVEVGDPLIKRTGVAAIEAIKRRHPEISVVAEMMSADWGRDQVELAAEAGADVVLLIGPASLASVSAAACAARRLGVALVLDAAPERAVPTWLRDMERAGIDGFAVTTNIDLGIGSHHPLTLASTIRRHSQLPVAVSGGFSTDDETLLDSDDWDIAILGRGAADAVNPAAIAEELRLLTRDQHRQEQP